MYNDFLNVLVLNIIENKKQSFFLEDYYYYDYYLIGIK